MVSQNIDVYFLRIQDRSATLAGYPAGVCEVKRQYKEGRHCSLPKDQLSFYELKEQSENLANNLVDDVVIRWLVSVYRGWLQSWDVIGDDFPALAASVASVAATMVFLFWI